MRPTNESKNFIVSYSLARSRISSFCTIIKPQRWTRCGTTEQVSNRYLFSFFKRGRMQPTIAFKVDGSNPFKGEDLINWACKWSSGNWRAEKKRRERKGDKRNVLVSLFHLGFLSFKGVPIFLFRLRIEGKKKQLFPMAVPDEFQATHSVSLLFAAGNLSFSLSLSLSLSSSLYFRLLCRLDTTRLAAGATQGKHLLSLISTHTMCA